MAQSFGVDGNSSFQQYDFMQKSSFKLEDSDYSLLFNQDVDMTNLSEEEKAEVIKAALSAADRNSLIKILLRLLGIGNKPPEPILTPNEPLTPFPVLPPGLINGPMTPNPLIPQGSRINEPYLEYNSQTGKTVEEYEDMFPIVMKNGIFTVERPTTAEFQEHDKYMEKVKQDYIRNHPEPEERNNLIKCINNSEHDNWQIEMNKYMQAQEKIYREQHPEYAKQAQAFENKLKQASIMC